MTMKIPSKETLSVYGLTEEEWELHVTFSDPEHFNPICPICLRSFDPKWKQQSIIDHEHVKGWNAHTRAIITMTDGKKVKGKKVRVMPPEERKKYVRGIICWLCNKNILTREVTLEKARRVVTYLEKYESRKAKENHG